MEVLGNIVGFLLLTLFYISIGFLTAMLLYIIGGYVIEFFSGLIDLFRILFE